MFLLAIENGLPIVPVTIVGSRVVMPKGRFTVSPGDGARDRARRDSDAAA